MQHQSIPHGYCQCGCGQKTSLAAKTNRSKGWIKGEPKRYLNGHNGVVNRSSTPRYVVAGDGCWVWQGAKDALGYGRMWSREKGGAVLAHRWHYEQRFGPCPTDTLDHLCRNPSCVNPDHLEPTSRQENVRRGKGTKLDWEKVRLIRTSQLSNVALARMLGVDDSTVGNVRAGRCWLEEDR